MIKMIVNNEDKGSVMLDEVLNEVKVENIEDMLFTNVDGIQTVSILVKDNQENMINYLMRATKGYEIHGINQVLKSLNLGVTVEFVNFNQYDLMIDYCMNLIHTNKKVTA